MKDLRKQERQLLTVILGLVTAFILGWIALFVAIQNGWIVVIEKMSGGQ